MDSAAPSPLAPADIWAYVPEFAPAQRAQIERLIELLIDHNTRVNLVSRADVQHLAERHVLHSLLMTRAMRFAASTEVIDVGTGGGFPGLPLAIAYPESRFLLVDSTAKKIAAVSAMIESLGLANVSAQWVRAEELARAKLGAFDFVLGRAVATLPEFWRLVRPFVHCRSRNPLPNGLLYLKGGDLAPELKPLPRKASATVWNLHDWAPLPFFETKRLVHLSDCA